MREEFYILSYSSCVLDSNNDDRVIDAEWVSLANRVSRYIAEKYNVNVVVLPEYPFEKMEKIYSCAKGVFVLADSSIVEIRQGRPEQGRNEEFNCALNLDLGVCIIKWSFDSYNNRSINTPLFPALENMMFLDFKGLGGVLKYRLVLSPRLGGIRETTKYYDSLSVCVFASSNDVCREIVEIIAIAADCQKIDSDKENSDNDERLETSSMSSTSSSSGSSCKLR